MISKEYKILGLPVSFNVPTSVGEYDQLAKKAGACLESAIANYMYRGLFAEARANFIEAVEGSSKIARRTKETGKTRTVKGENGAPDTIEAIVVYDETEGDYFKRVQVEQSATAESYIHLMVQVASTLVFNPSGAETVARGPKTISKKFIEAAQSILDQGKGDIAASKLEAKLGIPVEPTLDGLSKAIAEDQRRKSVAAEYV